MFKRPHGLVLLLGIFFLSQPSAGENEKTVAPKLAHAESARSELALLWREPNDIRSRNLFYGPGGKQHEPHGPFKFVEEDPAGTNPKYVVRDRDNIKWTVKLGMEARPETVASRLVWAVGYFTNEDYFLQDLQVAGMPPHVKRGAELIGPGGIMHAARLKRHIEGQKKIENWKWRDEAFAGTRELNGLKVMMALINNWDLKDENNEVYSEKDSPDRLYVISDLGASFGATGLSFPFSHSKGNLSAYAHSKFITRISPEYVDFRTPSRPALIYAFNLPGFLGRVRLDGLAHHIPRADAAWIGHVLARLSPAQIQDAFRAAGFEPAEIDAYSGVVRSRIAELNSL
jgi:hypothetical protein